jgi:hypothetical protein
MSTKNLTAGQLQTLMSEACDKMDELYDDRRKLHETLTALRDAVGEVKFGSPLMTAVLEANSVLARIKP